MTEIIVNFTYFKTITNCIIVYQTMIDFYKDAISLDHFFVCLFVSNGTSTQRAYFVPHSGKILLGMRY